jgi:hypothetical protein
MPWKEYCGDAVVDGMARLVTPCFRSARRPAWSAWLPLYRLGPSGGTFAQVQVG